MTLTLWVDDPPMQFNANEKYDFEVSFDGDRITVSGLGQEVKRKGGRIHLDLSALENMSGAKRLKIYLAGDKIASFDMRTFDREFDKMRIHCGM